MIRFSDQIDKILPAFRLAQMEFPVVPKNRTGKILTKTGREYSYKYADLADILSACMPILNKHLLGFTQGAVGDRMLTRIFHEGGQWLENEVPMVAGQAGPQGMGSTLTYFKRYGFSAITGVVAEEDDDAQVAQGGGRNDTAPKQQQHQQNSKPPQQQKQTPPAAAKLEPIPRNPADFRITFGKEFNGKRVSECALDSLADYILRLENHSGKPLTGNALQLKKVLDLLYEDLANDPAPPSEENPPF